MLRNRRVTSVSLRNLVAAVVGVLVLVACGSGAGDEGPAAVPRATINDPAPTSTTIPPHISVVATAKVPSVGVYETPQAPEPARSLAHPTSTGAPLVFLVKEQFPEWLIVHLPLRPNGSLGWIRTADVDLSTHDFRIVIELGAHRISVWQGENLFHQEPVGVGTKTTPTPGGLFYTRELHQPVDEAGNLYPDGPYGPYAYVLSGFSDVLYDFAGGQGELGIHGTNNPGGLGKDVSHGCIRMSNEGITKLAGVLPLGVPVEVKR